MGTGAGAFCGSVTSSRCRTCHRPLSSGSWTISPWRARSRASTQNLALNALVFLFKEVLAQPLDKLLFAQAKRAKM